MGVIGYWLFGYWLLKAEMVLTYKNLARIEFYPNLISK